MHATHVASLLRAVATSPSRRAVARALTGVALAGAVIPLLGLTELDAKRNKKKRRRRKKKRQKKANQPFCTGKDVCVDGYEQSRCNNGGAECFCYVTAESGIAFCGHGESLPPVACSDCAAGETCADVSGCGGELRCVPPCANPL